MRGIRSTVLLVDEFRLVDDGIIASVLAPTEIIRPTPYIMKPEYKHLKEEPREIYLSSAYFKSHWMWGLIKTATIDMYKGEAILYCADLALTLRHNIKTPKQLIRERKKSDSTIFDMEYNNLMVGGSANQYYSYELISSAQKIKKAWYPKTVEEVIENKKVRFGDIKKIAGEKRIVAMDVALSISTKKTKNDLSVIKCIRAVQNGEKYDRQEVYTEAFEGKDTTSQAIRIRQILEDYNADYLVIDARNFGMSIIDELGKVLYDEERDKEYVPIKCFNNQELADRCKNKSALPIIYGFIATAERNDEMHKRLKGALVDGKYKMLISNLSCKEQYLLDKREYEVASAEEKARYELPYIYSDLTLNEMINLEAEYVQASRIKLVEPNNGTKDKYVTSAMGNYFVQELEMELTNKKANKRFDPRRAVKFRQPKTHS